MKREVIWGFVVTLFLIGSFMLGATSEEVKQVREFSQEVQQAKDEAKQAKDEAKQWEECWDFAVGCMEKETFDFYIYRLKKKGYEGLIYRATEIFEFEHYSAFSGKRFIWKEFKELSK